MKIAQIEIEPWKPFYEFEIEEKSSFKKGDLVRVSLDSQSVEIGKIIDFKQIDKSSKKIYPKEIEKISKVDLEKIKYYKEREFEAKCIFRELARKHNLPMKVCYVHFALAGRKITFAFIAETKLDFRAFLKDLTSYFQKPIKLEQIGARDEARKFGKIGVCGRELCCAKFLNQRLKNISKEMAKTQGLKNASTERITGMCGRLLCCLDFE